MVNSSVLRPGLHVRVPDPATHGAASLLATPPKTKNWNPPAQTETLPDPASRANGGIAQLVERRLCKPNVAGPSPTASTNLHGRVAQLVRASH